MDWFYDRECFAVSSREAQRAMTHEGTRHWPRIILIEEFVFFICFSREQQAGDMIRARPWGSDSLCFAWSGLVGCDARDSD